MTSLIAQQVRLPSLTCKRCLSLWIIGAGSKASNALDFFGFRPASFSPGTSSGCNPTPLQLELLDRAAQVRESLGSQYPTFYDETADGLSEKLFYSSSFALPADHRRGFCNWVIPHRLMIGQYPSQTPEEGGPTEAESRQHLQMMQEDAHVGLFCSLQSELPAQDDYETWSRNSGRVFLEPDHVRRRFPHPFVHYAPILQELNDNNNDKVTFLHCPIEDLNVPESQEPLQQLLLQLLNFLEDYPQKAIYLHCWGGRGRAGLVGSCLISLIWPTLDTTDVLRIIQTGYASRLGHDLLPTALSRSPQTETQRVFVTNFVKEYQQLHAKVSKDKQ